MNTDSKAKFVYVFVAGVEGVGHHGLNPVLETAFQNSHSRTNTNGIVITNKKRLKRAFNQIWCSEHPFNIVRSFFRRYLHSFFRKQKTLAEQNGQVRILIEDNSFPAGRYRNLDRQWKLSDMINIVTPHADDIYVIALFRDPAAAVYSHKNFDGGLFQHAEMISNALKYLNNELSNINPKNLLVAHYEELINQQDALGAKLASFLNLDAEDLRMGFSKVRPSKKNWRQELPLDEQERLLEIFSNENAKTHWPIFCQVSRAPE